MKVIVSHLLAWVLTLGLLAQTATAGTVRVALTDGDVDIVETSVYSPFVVYRRELRNAGHTVREVSRVEFALQQSLAGAAQEYRTLGVDGLKGAETAASSYLFLGIARPNANNGIVAGWITQERGSGSVHSTASDKGFTIVGRLEFGNLRLKPGQRITTDAFVVGHFTDARQGLETYADTIAKANHIKLPQIPNGYCTWYSKPHGGPSDERAMAELSAFCARELTKYGFDTILVDDQWQGPSIRKGGIIGSGPTGNFTGSDPHGPYPSGMKANAEQLTARGLRAGLWFTPFSWDPRDPLFKEHQDWFVKKPDGTRLYFLHNRVWHNDPDCLMLRAPLSLEQARSFASWIALSGYLNLVSEWLPELPADRLECLKRCLPNTGLAARPLDLFENAPARAWYLTNGKRHVLGLFNWDAGKPIVESVRISDLGLNPAQALYAGLDYWSGRLVLVHDGIVSTELPPSGCSIIAIAQVLDRPQLLGTSRHITQCFVDVVGEEKWTKDTLSGTCKLVGGDPTELRVLTTSTQDEWKATSVELSKADQNAGVTAKLSEEPGLLRLSLAAPVNREVHWSLHFGKKPS